MRIRKAIRDIPAGDPEATVDVDVILKVDDSPVDTVTTNADGLATYEQDGNPGPLLFEATVGSQTKRYDTQAEAAIGLLTPIDISILTRGLGFGYIPDYTDPVTTNGGLAVSPGTGLQVVVAEGAFLGDGMVYRCTSATNLTVPANSSGSTRYDRVIVRLTREGQTEEGKCQLIYLQGTSSSAGPSLTNDATVREYSLAKVTVANSASSLVSGNIADERYNTTLKQAPAFRWPGAFSGGTAPVAGDVFYANANGQLTRLPKGTDDQILTLTSGIPAWEDAPSTTHNPVVSNSGVNDYYSPINITSAGQTVASCTLTLLDGVVYDVICLADMQGSAPPSTGTYVQAFALVGGGSSTEGSKAAVTDGERWIGAMQSEVVTGTGAAITCSARANTDGGTGRVNGATVRAWATPRT